MRNKNIINQLKYSVKLIDIFNLYIQCLDEYFEDEEKKETNKELYNYYCNLKNNIINSAQELGVINK